jgi:hypothetical protein
VTVVDASTIPEALWLRIFFVEGERSRQIPALLHSSIAVPPISPG